jgi:hypothetical protein
MNRKSLILSFVLVFLLAACTAPATPQPTPAPDETYLVYTAMMDYTMGQRNNPSQVVVVDTTGIDNITLPQLQAPDPQRFSKFDSSLLSALAQSAAQPLHLESQFTGAGKVLLVSQADLDAIFKTQDYQAGWDAFGKAYAGAHSYYTFSRVVFNTAGDQALMYFSTHCGGLCGGGNLVLLAKENGAWVVKTMQMTWIS